MERFALSDLVAEPELYPRSASDKPESEQGSEAQYREKEEVLTELESLVAEQAAIAELAHDENVGEWARESTGWMQQQGLTFAQQLQIHQDTGLVIMQVWLAAMLDGMKLEQRGGFYVAGGLIVTTTSGKLL